VQLGFGADVDAQDFRGYTPLYLATIRGHLQIVSLLMQQGTLLSRRSWHSELCRPGYCTERFVRRHRFACCGGKEPQRCTSSIHQNCSFRLHHLTGIRKVVANLLDNGANFAERDRAGNTPLHYAAVAGYLLIRICHALRNSHGVVDV